MTQQELELATRTTAQLYQGGFAWLTVTLGLCVFIAYAATPVAVVSGTLPLWVGCLLMIVLTYAAYTVLHDAAHGSISGSHASLRWVNEWMGYGAAFILLIPLTAHRHEHRVRVGGGAREQELGEGGVAEDAERVAHALAPLGQGRQRDEVHEIVRDDVGVVNVRDLYPFDLFPAIEPVTNGDPEPADAEEVEAG